MRSNSIKKYIIVGTIIVIVGTIFQIYYNYLSEQKHKIIYKNILIEKSKIHFENIMLKKAQNLAENLTITNEKNNVKFIALDPNNKNIPIDEKNIVQNMIASNQKEKFSFSKDREYFYYYNILDVKQECISCHNIYKVGEIAGGIKLSIPTSEYKEFYKSYNDSKRVYVTINILFAIIIVVLIIWFLNKNKQKHNTIKRSQRNLEKAEEMAKLGHLRVDLRTYDLSLSKNMKQILGIKKDHICLKELFNNIIVKRDRKKVLNRFIRSSKEYKNTKIEFRITRQDNNELRYVNCQISYIQNEDDQIIVAIGAVQDVTDFTKVRNELNILRLAVEQAPISVVITNEKGAIEYVNPSFCKTSGYEANEVIGQNPRILKSEYTKPQEYDKLWATISSGKTWSGTFKNITKDGKEYWEHAFLSPVFSPSTKKISKYIAVKEEITKEVYLQNELKYKEELMIAQSRHAAMGEMISMIAHQWRQPATVISLSANNILVDVKLDMIDNDSLLSNAQDIIDQTEYLSHTIDNFRNFFKPNKQRTKVTIQKIVDETMVLMLATLNNNDITLEEKYESKLEFITFEKELMQVFINIIKNAQEVLKNKNITDKKITIREYTKDNNVIIQFYDNAGGIEEENIHKIFEPYFTTKDEMNGTGLGLYISKVIIEKHLNGMISAFNTKDGACFQITLNIGDIKNG